MNALDGWMGRWMDDLRFYILFNSISVISGRLTGDKERLCAMKFRLRLKKLPPPAGLKEAPEKRLREMNISCLLQQNIIIDIDSD